MHSFQHNEYSGYDDFVKYNKHVERERPVDFTMFWLTSLSSNDNI